MRVRTRRCAEVERFEQQGEAQMSRATTRGDKAAITVVTVFGHDRISLPP